MNSGPIDPSSILYDPNMFLVDFKLFSIKQNQTHS